MTSQEALNLLYTKIKNKNLLKHSFAVGVAMEELAQYFGEDKEKWLICGLLHDIDYEEIKGNPRLHSRVGAEFLENLGLEKEICQAILSHNEFHKISPNSKMAKALFCVDPLCGLIVAATLVLPSKKINDLKLENVLRRFKEKSFAKGANREQITKCQEYLNLPLEKFIEIVLFSMQKISKTLEL
jgi:putative nucleotidyltransferase with HDIG domain